MASRDTVLLAVLPLVLVSAAYAVFSDSRLILARLHQGIVVFSVLLAAHAFLSFLRARSPRHAGPLLVHLAFLQWGLFSAFALLALSAGRLDDYYAFQVASFAVPALFLFWGSRSFSKPLPEKHSRVFLGGLTALLLAEFVVSALFFANRLDFFVRGRGGFQWTAFPFLGVGFLFLLLAAASFRSLKKQHQRFADSSWVGAVFLGEAFALFFLFQAYQSLWWVGVFLAAAANLAFHLGSFLELRGEETASDLQRSEAYGEGFKAGIAVAAKVPFRDLSSAQIVSSLLAELREIGVVELAIEHLFVTDNRYLFARVHARLSREGDTASPEGHEYFCGVLSGILKGLKGVYASVHEESCGVSANKECVFEARPPLKSANPAVERHAHTLMLEKVRHVFP